MHHGSTPEAWHSAKDPMACASPDSIMATPGRVTPGEIEAFSLSSRFGSKHQHQPQGDDAFTEQLTAALAQAVMREPSTVPRMAAQQPQHSMGRASNARSASVDHSWCLEAMVGMVERTSTWEASTTSDDLDLLDILESMQDDDGGYDQSLSVLPSLGVANGMLPPTFEEDEL